MEHLPDEAGQVLGVASPESPVRHQALRAVAHVQDEGAESPDVRTDGVSAVVSNHLEKHIKQKSPFLDHP